MNALATWNGGVILISHDERFITSVAKEVSEWLHSFGIEADRNPSSGCALTVQSLSSRATSRHTRSVDRSAQWRHTLTSIRRASLSATLKRNREVLSPLGFHGHEKARTASRHVRFIVYLLHCCMSKASVPCHIVATCLLSQDFLASMTGCTVMWCF